MPSIINLSPIWEHTLTEILNHGNKTEVGIIMSSWVKDNNLHDMNDLLIHDLNDFTPTGSLSQYKESKEAEETKPMPITPLKELYNLYRYIQHLILESEFKYDDDEFENPDLKRLPLIPSSLIHLLLTQVSPWPRFLLVKEL